LSKLVHACRSYSLPKLARFFETQCSMSIENHAQAFDDSTLNDVQLPVTKISNFDVKWLKNDTR